MDDKANKSTWPRLTQLQDEDAIRDQFSDLLGTIDDEEHKLTNNTTFPFDIINQIGNLSYEELACYSELQLEEWLWDLSRALFRIQVHENRINKILGWINSKLNKAISLMPPDLMNYVERDVKYHMMANRYLVVRYLLSERDKYQQEQVHWTKIHNEISRRDRMMWHILNKQHENQRNNATV